jgi:hypothetical protein
LLLARNYQDIQVIYRACVTQQDRAMHQHRCDQENRRSAMFKKTLIALGAAALLVTAFGSASYAQQNPQEWWRAYEAKSKKGCVSGEESATSAYPAWMHCR